MKSSYERIEQSRQKLSPLGKIVSRTQFGGYSLSIHSTVFALIKEGEIYLRSSEQMSNYLTRHNLTPFMFIKRGSSVCLNYYCVDQALWQDDQQLLTLSSAAIQAAKQCQIYKQSQRRLKDLPNLGIRIESCLREVGINTEEQLRQLGAKQSWQLIHQRNRHLGLQSLYSLQGAILGLHHAVLSKETKDELRRWYQAFIHSYERTLQKKFISSTAGL